MSNRLEPSAPPPREDPRLSVDAGALALVVHPAERLDRHRARARAFLFGSSMCFGLAAVLTRVATRGGIIGGQAALGRFAVGLLGAVVILAARPGTFRPVNYRLLASRAAFGAISGVLYYSAIERIPAGQATLLNNTFPIWAVVLSVLFLDERPTVHLVVALLVASAGVFVVLGGGGMAFHVGAGQILGLASGIAGGASVTSMRRLRATDNVPTIFFFLSLGGTLAGLPFAAATWRGSSTAWLAVGASGIVTVAAQMLMTEAYGELEVAEAALWQQTTPIASYIWAALLVGEVIGGSTLVGILLGVSGIVYGSLLGHRPRDSGRLEVALTRGVSLEDP